MMTTSVKRKRTDPQKRERIQSSSQRVENRRPPKLGTQSSSHSAGNYGQPALGTQSIESFSHEEVERWNNIRNNEDLTGELTKLPLEDFCRYLAYREARRLQKKYAILEPSPDQKRLAEKQFREAKRREDIETREMRKYYRKNPFDKKTFHEDILNFGSLYVFCYGYANLESSTYKDFMQSLAEDRSNYKVYFAPNKALAYSVGLVKELTPEQQNLKPGDLGYITKEFDTGLHEIGCMLDEDECTGVLLTNKNEDEVLSKFREYKEFDFVKPGSTPMETLVFEKDVFLPLPPLSSARKLCPKLKKLGMPVTLSGQDIQLTERFVVCEVKKRVTEEASQILELLGIKMFDFVLLPMGCWIRTTKITRHFPYLSEVPCRD